MTVRLGDYKSSAALGVEDLTPYLARCEERNRRRGRYDAL